MKTCFILMWWFFAVEIGFGQTNKTDSLQLNYRKIYTLCLDANVQPAVQYISGIDSNKLSVTDRLFKDRFERRFLFDKDEEDVESQDDLTVLLRMYRNYWRRSLLDSSGHYDKALQQSLKHFFSGNKNLPDTVSEDSLDYFLKNYIRKKNLYTTGFGKTGRLYDLLLWKNQQDTTYEFATGAERLRARVVFMDPFVTLGWEEYATMGKFYPGGWASDTALFCVKKAYDLNSEMFRISYLAHEGRHLADYKLFTKLTSPDLEYRGKLTELSLADSILFDLIRFFIANANYDSENGHSLANYCVIRDLSLFIFHTPFEKDFSLWKSVPADSIRQASQKILSANTRALQALGNKSGDSIYIKKTPV